ncbi:MAG: exodeoxyribonuclease III [Rhizobiaceae bacterium]
MSKQPFKIATWNINSVRLRRTIVENFLAEHRPDVLCLQEIKCRDEEFPAEAFAAAGYTHQAICGQKAYHGVAILSRHPLEKTGQEKFCGIEDSRHVSALANVKGKLVHIHNFYVPAGGDEPDPVINPKFRHKLDFVEEMRRIRPEHPKAPSILVGDLNIAPLEHDVWGHKELLKVVSHTPVETSGFESMRKDGGWVDLMRVHAPEPEKLYTWWSYRAADWKISNRGRRLDHIWSSPDLTEKLSGIQILKEARDWDKPSDHVPVIASFGL